MVTREQKATVALALAAFYDYFDRSVRPDSIHESTAIDRDLARDTRRLSSVERATARIRVPAKAMEPDEFGVLPEAALRMGIFGARGALDRMSLHSVAQSLQGVFGQNHPRAMKNATTGWLVLELADRADRIEVWLASPDPNDPRHYRRVRLSERMREIREKTNVDISKPRSETGRLATR